MSHLNDLIKVGALQKSLKEISLDDYPNRVITFSEFDSMDDEDKNVFNGIVTVDDPTWCATIRGAKPTRAKRITSGDGGNKVGIYNREEKQLLLAELIDGKLNTIRRVTAPQPVNNKSKKEKETKIMADAKNVTIPEVNPSTPGAIGTPDMQKMQEFGTENLSDLLNGKGAAQEAPTVSDPEKDEAKAEAAKRKKEREEKIDRIQAKLADQPLANRTSIISKNLALGRFMGFVTKTNATVKVTNAKVFKTQNGKKILNADAPADVKRDYSEGKSVSSSNFQKRSIIKLRNSNPGAIVGGVIATPEAGRIDLNDLSDKDKVFKFDEKKTALKYSFHPLEELCVVLAAWYDGKIKESSEILGDKATQLEVAYTMVTHKSTEPGKPDETKIKPKLILSNKKVRKSLLYPGNYFPVKIFETIKYQNLSAEDAEVLNYNFASMLKNDSDNKLLNEFNETKPGMITKAPDGTVTSTVFATGKSSGGDDFEAVKAYYDKDVTLKEVSIAKREKRESKNGTITYPFVYHKLDDREAGPLSVPEYKEVFDSFQIDENTLINDIEKAMKTSKPKSVKKVTTDNYLQAALKGDGMIQGLTTPIAKIQENLLGLF